MVDINVIADHLHDYILLLVMASLIAYRFVKHWTNRNANISWTIPVEVWTEGFGSDTGNEENFDSQRN